MAKTGSDVLMEASQFNREVKAWTLKVKGISVNILSSSTHSSRSLQRRLDTRTRLDKDKVYVDALGFRFIRYGAFRAYGAGRGYIVQDGVIKRGHSAWSDLQIRSRMQKKGEKNKDIRKTKIFYAHGEIKRTPLNWLDSPIERHIEELANLAGEYHGDAALRDVLKQLNKITIKKNYGKE